MAADDDWLLGYVNLSLLKRNKNGHRAFHFFGDCNIRLYYYYYYCQRLKGGRCFWLAIDSDPYIT